MRLLVDMNLSPDWVPLLGSRGWKAIHWTSLGKGNEPDPDLLAWARANSHIVLTQGALLTISPKRASLRRLPIIPGE